MREGIDYAWGRPSPKAIKAAGKSFVVRYVSTPGNSKNITADEVRALKAAGIDIAIVFETTAGRALAGYSAGRHDATSAISQVRAAGGPSGSVIYFAVDFDADATEQVAINAYLKGAASVLGHDRTGVYGGFWVVKRALDAGVCKFAWQTYAWSGGRWDYRAQLQQYDIFPPRLDGVAVDLNRATEPNFGQWGFHLSPEEELRERKGFYAWVAWRLGEGDWKPYGPRNPAVRPNVPRLISAAWWLRLKLFLRARA